ncbi:hypothetical protein TELCIR_07475 [Teladorsagia circumcincta]|uniref:Uncharacterized protein n=1 Tax=Teladorsagia circumcincta TaxID=45464 RepID=A0A2G9ULQ2_TELCI|nr:hypothetical protein TELCIR_07475 [Teladorsagia circumcincta]
MERFAAQINRIRSSIPINHRHGMLFMVKPPQSQSTPKAAHHMQVRPESAAQMTKEQKLTWGRCEGIFAIVQSKGPD